MNINKAAAYLEGGFASTKQGLMERMGKTENSVEPEFLKDSFKRVEEMNFTIKEFCRRVTKETQNSTLTFEDSKMVADSLRSLHNNYLDDDFRNLALKIGEFKNSIEEQRFSLMTTVEKDINKKLQDFVSSDVKESIGCKKKYDRVRLSYEASLSQLKNLTKKQKVNLNRVLEAEGKRDNYEDAFEESSEEITDVVKSVLEKNDFYSLEVLSSYVDAYFHFYQNGFQLISDLKPFVDSLQKKISSKKKSYDDKQPLRIIQKLQAKQKRERKRRTAANRNAIFGIELEEILLRDGTDYPIAIDSAIQYLSDNAMETEGIFRISPSRLTLDEVIVLLDQGKGVEWKEQEIHVAAGVIKNYLRELPDPLLTHSLFDQWIKLDGIKTENEFTTKADELLAQLPKGNKSLLCRLLNLCQKIIANSSVNKMGAKQLAIVLAPNILYCNNEGGDPNKIVALHSSCNQVVFKLLSSYHSSLILNATPLNNDQNNTTTQQQSPSSSSSSSSSSSWKSVASINRKSTDSSNIILVHQKNNINNNNNNNNNNNMNSNWTPIRFNPTGDVEQYYLDDHQINYSKYTNNNNNNNNNNINNNKRK